MRYDTCACGNRKQARSGQCQACSEGPIKSPHNTTAQTDSVLIAGNDCTISKSTPERVKSLEDLIRVCEIDTAIWEVVEFRCSKSETMSVPRAVGKSREWERKSTEPVITPLYHVTAKCKRRVAVMQAREEIAALLKRAKSDAPIRAGIRLLSAAPPRATPTRMLEIAIPDLHIGKLAWAPETGHDSYDVKLARAAFLDALSALIARTKALGPFTRILFTVGNDLLHADTLEGTTTKGTRLETDSRFQKSFTVARELMTDAIDTLRALGPVHVPVISGNHDSLAAWTLGHSLECYFAKTADVTIDNAPTLRKYVHFEKNLLLLTHGDKGKKTNYPLIMAREQPALWGAARNHEVRIGHGHHEEVQEYSGVPVRMVPSLSSADAWHAANGYLARRAAMAFVWDGEEGVISQATYTVRSPQREDSRAA